MKFVVRSVFFVHAGSVLEAEAKCRAGQVACEQTIEEGGEE